MFSGIIERLAAVKAVQPLDGSLRLTIGSGYDDLALGESVAVNGVCLTVAALGDGGQADFFVSPESLARTNLGQQAAGRAVNLERAVRLDTRLSGHLVQGHVDGVGRLVAVEEDGEARRLTFALPAALAAYCVEKGSIALNGISLTLNGIGPVADGEFPVAVTIIPHTWTHTNLGRLAVGDRVNVEVDVIAKYVESLCLPYLKR
ncbi:riboflavin synthase [Oryzibacter oryziterrae]|uniref:riboflavin synthase n=1 Tax=Oryzibacter oryziterrae TaxID=2766474 RepID=UPI001F18368B|nr:riboflavin synthase [Oryzibacter oryziterrae]